MREEDTTMALMTPAATNDSGWSQAGESASTSVGRALQLLDCFRLAGPYLGVSEIARMSGLPKSTAFRLLGNLSREGCIERHGGRYRLAVRMFELGSRIVDQQPDGLRDACFPYLIDLHVRTGQTVHLGVLQGADVVYVEKIHGHNSRPTPTAIGARMPASCVGLGKAILAFSAPEVRNPVVAGTLVRRTPFSIVEPGRFARHLEQVRSAGLALDREESVLGLACVAAPLMADGRPWAAISVSGGSHLLNTRACASHVAEAATRMTSVYQSLQQPIDAMPSG